MSASLTHGLPSINVNFVVAKPTPGGWKAADIAQLQRTVSQLGVQLDAVKQTLTKAKMDVAATLVDTPGVNDNNGARDRVVKEYLKNADSVWIVSNIKRAVNDRTAKDMLSESFRLQLLMDGQYGQIVFVATQSDDLHASELRDNLVGRCRLNQVDP